MKKTGFYVIKDFFEKMEDPYLKSNKEGNRSHCYCFKEDTTGVYWMIPLSSHVGKYRKIIENKELAELSRTLGTINTKVPIKDDLTDLKVEEWDKEKVLELFENLNFNRYIDRFNLRENTENENKQEIKELY